MIVNAACGQTVASCTRHASTASTTTSKGSCHFPAAVVARDVGQFARLVSTVYPGAETGDVEPVTPGAYQPDAVTAIDAWHDTYRSVTGAAFPFFFADVNNRTVEQTRRALQTQSALTSFLEKYQGRPPAEMQREFVALLASLKKAPLPPAGGEGDAAVVPQEKIPHG